MVTAAKDFEPITDEQLHALIRELKPAEFAEVAQAIRAVVQHRRHHPSLGVVIVSTTPGTVGRAWYCLAGLLEGAKPIPSETRGKISNANKKPSARLAAIHDGGAVTAGHR